MIMNKSLIRRFGIELDEMAIMDLQQSINYLPALISASTRDMVTNSRAKKTNALAILSLSLSLNAYAYYHN
jgi:hypothetical protein